MLGPGLAQDSVSSALPAGRLAAHWRVWGNVSAKDVFVKSYGGVDPAHNMTILSKDILNKQYTNHSAWWQPDDTDALNFRPQPPDNNIWDIFKDSAPMNRGPW